MRFNAAVMLMLLFASTSFAADQPAIPDFTAGDRLERDAPHDWNLGPTGARGWVYARRGESTDSRQILVTSVADGSPSDDMLIKDDVILGIGEVPFTEDARIAIAKAITTAEAGDGRLKLMRWRNGDTQSVTLQLESLGRYSATAPFGCEKSQRILDVGCEKLAARMGGRRRRAHPIVRSLNALALLASGKKEYLPIVKEEALWAASFKIEERDLHSWSSGWVNIFLAEYVLATGDRSFLPALHRLSGQIAQGQSHVGTWGHRFAYPHNGILRGYGAMNQVGLNLTISLILAKQAGVRDESVDRAVEKSQGFLRFYVDRGAIPYGDHHPWLKMHDDNGKCSAAAVMFDYLDDSDAATFYARMATASYGIERETGHTGNFFNMLWALPGVSRLGPEATGAWIGESAWLMDLARSWDYSFPYNGKPAATGGEHSYRGWDCTGAYLLSYALERKKLRMTGSQTSVARSVNRTEAGRLIADGRGWMPIGDAESYDQKTTDELLRSLKNWSPVVRQRAAIALKKRPDLPVAPLIEMAGSADRHARHGACAALEELGPKATDAVAALTDLLGDDDLWLRVQAAEALAAIGAPARSAVPDLLKLVAMEPDNDDPRAMVQRYIAFALFYPGRALKVRGLLARNLGDVDRELLVAATTATLENEDGRVRDAVGNVYAMLNENEIESLLPAVYRAVVRQAPSGVMFSDGIRLRGLELLAKHRVAEGLPLCISLIEPDRWGSDRRFDRCLKILGMYGGSAKTLLPQLRELEQETRAPRSKGHQRHGELVKLIASIESAPDAEPLRPLR